MIPVIRYNTPDGEKIVKQILSRSQIENKNVQEIVDSILANVKENGVYDELVEKWEMS